jgi:hypothetical protein
MPTTMFPLRFPDSNRLNPRKSNTPRQGYRFPSTTPVPTTFTAEPVTEGFDLLRTKASADAPQIQVYIVQGPNGPQVQTKTVNSKEGQKQPNVQVYVIDENNKEKATYNHYSHNNQKNKNAPDLLKAQSHNQYYQYSHSANYQPEESQVNRQTTRAPEDLYTKDEESNINNNNNYYRDIEYEDDDSSYATTGSAAGGDVRSAYHQFLPHNKVQSLQSIYNANAYPNLRNFTDGSVPETACTRPGLFQHPNDCNKFYECYYDRYVNKYTLHLFECPVKLAFDSRIVGCSGPTDPTVCVQY